MPILSTASASRVGTAEMVVGRPVNQVEGQVVVSALAINLISTSLRTPGGQQQNGSPNGTRNVGIGYQPRLVGGKRRRVPSFLGDPSLIGKETIDPASNRRVRVFIDS